MRPDQDQAAIAAIERAMVRIRRRQTRRSLAPRHRLEVDASIVGVLDAVDEGPRGDAGVTVGLVAQRLGMHASNASRLASRAIELGLLRRAASQADGRKSILELTSGGKRTVSDIKASRRAAFDAATTDWSSGEREEFADLLARFVDALDQRTG